GWGSVIVVDHDLVEESNRSRSVLFAAAAIGAPKTEAVVTEAARINPDCHVVPLFGDLVDVLSPGLLRRSDLVLSCLDSVQSRYNLGWLAMQANRYWIDGGMTPWEAAVTGFAPGLACYSCTLTEQDLRDLSARQSCAAYASRAE